MIYSICFAVALTRYTVAKLFLTDTWTFLVLQACCWILSGVRHAWPVVTYWDWLMFWPERGVDGRILQRPISCWSYQGRLLRLWGARRAVRGGWTAPVTGIGHVPICQGLKRRQSVLIHRDAVQGLCKHCQQVGLIFFIYLLRRGKNREGRQRQKTEMGVEKKIGHFSQEKLHLSFTFFRESKGCGWLHADFHC